MNTRRALGGFSLFLCFIPLSVCFVLFACGVSSAVVRDDRIAPGLRFENVRYNWNSIFIDVVNMTDRNKLFGGTMIFLDRHGNPVASARLLPHKIVRNSARRYTGYFISGAGETARRASRVIWDFGPR
ncbi:MAG: hypothetical protein LBT65_10085 [Synergistaceae bacterium]|jgi:hypothetical protein|nr:hypothetical protein [Synergistaceae bacterium]